MKLISRIVFMMAMIGALALVRAPLASAAEDLLCSTYPVYLFTRNLAEGRDRFQVNLMIDSARGCPHDYAPTPAELERLSQARVLVINGLGLEGFLGRALKVARPDLKILDASGGRAPGGSAEPPVILIGKEAAAAMFAGHHHDGPNPHLFVAPGPASAMVSNIAFGLTELDPEGADIYRNNAARLSREMTELSAAFDAARARLGGPKVIISHSVFEYMTQALNMTVVATVEEEDGAEPSAARLAELVRLARREGVRAVLVDPQGNLNLARTLGSEARIPVAVIDPVAAGPLDAPLDYYRKVMLTNLDVLVELFTKPAAPAGAPAKSGSGGKKK